MKKILLFTIVICSVLPVIKAQQIGDTIVVETFNYTQTYGSNQWSPGIRDTVIDFSVLPDLAVEKVLMLYNMRCKDNKVSNSTHRDQGCGEWDASCNTFIHDSTRVDSILKTHPNYIISNFSESTFVYTTTSNYNYYQFELDEITLNNISNENSYQITNGVISDSTAIDGSQFSGKSQYLYTATELTNAGFSTGEIDGLELQSLNNSNINFFRIKLKETTTTTLEASIAETSGFSEVYYSNFNFVTGSNEIIFSTPFTWNGTDNIIVEFSFTNSEPSNPVNLSSSSSTNMGLVANNMHHIDLSNGETIEVPTDSMSSISNEVTVSFWAYGHSNLLPAKTFVVFVHDSLGNRSFNTHLPWDNGQIYFDCGNTESDYDRIQKVSNENEFEGQWQHWAFTKNATTGNMSIYLNGSLWHSETGKTKPINFSEMEIRGYKGKIDELRIWDKELSESDINGWKNLAVNSTHPNYSNLIAYFRMDEGNDTLLSDLSNNEVTAVSNSPFIWKNERGQDLSRFFNTTSSRPNLTLLRGDYDISVSLVTVTDSVIQAPLLVQEYTISSNSGTLINDEVTLISENEYWNIETTTYNGETGEEISTADVNSEGSITISDLEYFDRSPSKIEIMSFVTPYGLGLDLGPEGKTWTFDMTDYLPILKDQKRMTIERGGQWMEDMDIKFLFILGTPPRDVIGFNQIWKAHRSSFNNLQSNKLFPPRDILLNPNGEFFKIRSSITGHGQEGEFIPRQHFININEGASEFNWQVWTECADNPIYPQGGTWIYDRAGWCPGHPSDIQHFDITALVNAGETTTIDYGVQNATGTTNYLINNQLITYSGINHNLDASIVEVKEPSNRVEFSRFNSICHTPKAVIKNTGEATLTSLVIKYWINESSNPLNYNWTGSLEFDETEIVNLPSSLELWTPVEESNNVFHVEVSAPNGGEDEYEHNNFYHSKFEIPEVLPEEIVVYFKTNSAGYESSYKIVDDEGNIILEKNGLTNNTLHRDTIEIAYGCYTFKVQDAGDDGIDFWANNDGTGLCRIYKLGGGIIKNFDGDYGDNINFQFTVGTSLSFEELEVSQVISIFPNPAQLSFSVEGKDIQKSNIRIIDYLGKKIQIKSRVSSGKVTFDSSKLAKGVYLIKINSNKYNETKKVIIE